MDADEINVQEGKELVKLARSSVESYVKKRKLFASTSHNSKKSGVFVTIYHLNQQNKQKNLRGCIGYVLPSKNIHDSVIDAAINAATQDPRFIALREKELDEVIFEVSILTKPFRIRVEDTNLSLNKIIIGRDGLMLESRYGSGLFLPQVPIEQNWNVRQYLTNLCYKAGAPSDAWLLPDSNLYTFRSYIFREKLPNS